MLIKKKPKFDLDKKEFNCWIDFSDLNLEGLPLNKIEAHIKDHLDSYLKSNNYDLIDNSIVIQSRDSDDYYSHDIFYFNLLCKYSEEYINKKKVEYQIKLDEYNEWYAKNELAIQEELEKRKKKEQHNSKIREIQAQIEV